MASEKSIITPAFLISTLLPNEASKSLILCWQTARCQRVSDERLSICRQVLRSSMAVSKFCIIA